MNRKHLAATGAAIAAGSIALAALGPISAAVAQDTTPPTTPPATGAPAQPRQSLDDVLKSLVDDGTLTQAQADTVKSKLGAAHVGGPRGGHGHGMAPGMRGGGVAHDEVATFLGITVEQLRTELQSGKTIAQLAGDRTAALIDQLVASANKRIDDAVTAGKMTAEQATQLKANTKQRITDMVNGVKPQKPARTPATN